jgi:hypothetical protein
MKRIILVTINTKNKVAFYQITEDPLQMSHSWVLHEQLDLDKVPAYPDKSQAAAAARKAELPGWRYITIA